jgi:tRNA-intron endonuclease
MAVKDAVKALAEKDCVVTENSDAARELFNQSRFGALMPDGRIQLSYIEALYLVENERLVVVDARSRAIPLESLEKKARKLVSDFRTLYAVFRDLRTRGYVVKTALKFGADFRVYERGKKPGEEHAKWVVFPVHESGSLTWHEFSAKNRVAHSTKKNLLIAVVDDEGDVSYWEVGWLKP